MRPRSLAKATIASFPAYVPGFLRLATESGKTVSYDVLHSFSQFVSFNECCSLFDERMMYLQAKNGVSPKHNIMSLMMTSRTG